MRKLNLITNLKSDKIYNYMNIHEDQMSCNFHVGNTYYENVIFTTQTTKWILIHKVN